MKQYAVPLFTEGKVRVDAELEDGAPVYIETEELTLSPLFDEPVADLKEANQKTEYEYVTEYLKWNPTESNDPVTDFVEQSEDMWGDCYMYAVREKETDDLIGVAANNVEPFLNRSDIGVWVSEPEWESKYAPKIFSAIASASFEFMDIELVKGKADVDKDRSIRSLQKSILGLGGSFEGLIRNHSKKKENGEYSVRDIVVYSISKDEFYTFRKDPKDLDEMIEESTDKRTTTVSLIV